MKLKSVVFLNAVRLPNRYMSKFATSEPGMKQSSDYICLADGCVIVHKDHKSVCVPLAGVVSFETAEEPAVHEFSKKECSRVGEKGEHGKGGAAKKKGRPKKKAPVL
jgi:hypothetical protein